MLSSVAKSAMLLGAILLAGFSGAGLTHPRQLSPDEQQAWKNLQASVVSLDVPHEGGAMAAFLGQDGLFIAQRSVVTGNKMTGKRLNGKSMQFVVISRDAASQLALLKAVDGFDDMVPIKSPSLRMVRGTTLLAVLASGPIKAELADSQKVGVLTSTRRLVPLNELRCEAPNGVLGNALVFTKEGQFVGAINATLASPQNYGKQNAVTTQLPGGTPQTPEEAKKGGLGAPAVANAVAQNMYMGPSPLMVAYTPAVEITVKAFNGFLSASRTPKYATLGVMCKDAYNGGALIQQIDPSGPAAKGGLILGDVIEDMGGLPIRNQIDFARALYRVEAGSKLAIRVRRTMGKATLTVTLGEMTLE